MKTFFLLLILVTGTSLKTPYSGCLQLDLILLGDMSGSVQGNERFVSESFISFIDKFDLSENGVQIGIILFNNNAFVINQITDNKELLKRNAISIKSTPANNGTFLANGLISSFEQLVKNGRKGYRKIIIVVSDGAVDDQVGSRMIIRQLQQVGVQLCGVLILNGSSSAQFMKEMCGECYGESDYEMLGKELEKLDICL